MPFVLFCAWSSCDVAHINAVCVLVQKLHTVTSRNVIHVAPGTFFTEKAAFLNQLCHSLQRLFLPQHIRKRYFAVCCLDLLYTERTHFHIMRRVNIRI